MSAFRLLAVRAVRSSVLRAAVRPAASVAAPVRAAWTPVASLHSWQPRLMAVDPTAAPPALSSSEVQERVLDVVRKFEKIKDPNAVTATASFKDLGLDSLDAVEVGMALEDEFGVEIPDADADKIQSVADAIKYIGSNSKAQ